MPATETVERFSLSEWARLETYHPAVRLMAQWAWGRPAQGEPPLSPGGFADYVGVSRRVMTRWLQAPVTGPLPLLTFQVARQVARATGVPLDQVLFAAAITVADDPLFDTCGAWAYVIAQVEQYGPREPARAPDDGDQPMEARRHRAALREPEAPGEGAGDAPQADMEDVETDVAAPGAVASETAQWAADLAAGAVSLRDLCVWYLRAVAPHDRNGSERP